MLIRVNCPICGKTLIIPDDYRLKSSRLKCPKCDHPLKLVDGRLLPRQKCLSSSAAVSVTRDTSEISVQTKNVGMNVKHISKRGNRLIVYALIGACIVITTSLVTYLSLGQREMDASWGDYHQNQNVESHLIAVDESGESEVSNNFGGDVLSHDGLLGGGNERPADSTNDGRSSIGAQSKPTPTPNAAATEFQNPDLSPEKQSHGGPDDIERPKELLLAKTDPFTNGDAEHYALLIGVRQYIPTELTNLKYTENDVVRMGDVLRQRGYEERNIVLMTQTIGADKAAMAPTSANIRRQLELLLAVLEEGDTILVAVSGHGVQFEGEDEDYFCPSDARLADRTTLISLKELYNQLETSKASAKVLMVDACRDDPQTDLAKSTGRIRLEPVHENRPVVAVEGGTIAFKSCGRTQQSFEDPRLEHGIYFYHVIEGLKGAADADWDGEITASELEAFATRQVKNYARAELGVVQIPTRFSKGEVSGDIVLAKRSRVRPEGLAGPFSEAAEKSSQQRWAEYLGREVAVKSKAGIELVLIPPGEFMMGSPEDEAGRHKEEGPQHLVKISRPFYMGETEVTQGQWKAVMGTEPWKGEKYVKEGTNYPATYVSWEDAMEYCRRLSERDDREYRLPTEAEWEYACRGGSTGRYSFGDDVSALGRYAWFEENADDKDEKYAHLVRKKLANPFGLFDMHGNVWEWCSDWYGEKYYGESPSVDPAGPNDGKSRVFRGGSWIDSARFSRSARRHRHPPTYRHLLLGFRLVSVISE